MKFLILLLCLWSITIIPLSAQWQWGKYSNGPNEDYGRLVGTDALGNVYAVGQYKSSPFTFQNTSSIYNTNQSSTNIFIAKYSTSGVLLWTQSRFYRNS